MIFVEITIEEFALHARTRLARIALPAAILAVASVTACAASDGVTVADSSTPAPAVTSVVTRTVAAPATKHSQKAQLVAPKPTSSHRSATRAAGRPGNGSWVMPNLVGRDLQTAQDEVQRVSGNPVFFSHSHDLIDDRFQILDRDWKVCDQNVVAGKRVSAVAHIDFGVVKVYESCP